MLWKLKLKRAAVLWSILAVCFGALLVEVGCSPKANEVEVLPSGEGARILVTTDFGSEVVIDAVVPVTHELSAMEALEKVADVDTSYGGGFVSGINGIGTGVSGRSAKLDWFYSINGFTARTGAASYVLHNGDIEHWDYRNWSFRRNVSATLGAFPAAYVRGYGGNVRASVVIYGTGFQDEADKVAAFLRTAGSPQVDVVPLNGATPELFAGNNVIVIAPCDSPPVQEVNANWDRLGLFASFEGASLSTYGPDGEERGTCDDSCGAVFAIQNLWSPGGTGACDSMALVVTGTDGSAVRDAAETLIANHSDLVRLTGILVQGDTWQPLP
ncbi:MAG: DUF4430 domain-containing protein [Chloroflexota bacterium]